MKKSFSTLLYFVLVIVHFAKTISTGSEWMASLKCGNDMNRRTDIKT